ncbi:MAG: ribosome maturation factor RimP [Oscillospiraceae bacterium]|nr:ribosome maturation factor RimP [Oscillospiraceae bacterium]
MAEKTVNPGNTAHRARRIGEPVAKSLGLQLWDVRYLKEGSNWYLRYWIDKAEGVTLDDCEAFSRAVDPALDEEDFIEQFYYLEVCSPGIERELTRDEHFTQYIGSIIKVRGMRPFPDGSKEANGILIAYTDGVIAVERQDGTVAEIPKKSCACVRLAEAEQDEATEEGSLVKGEE